MAILAFIGWPLATIFGIGGLVIAAIALSRSTRLERRLDNQQRELRDLQVRLRSRPPAVPPPSQPAAPPPEKLTEPAPPRPTAEQVTRTIKQPPSVEPVKPVTEPADEKPSPSEPTQPEPARTAPPLRPAPTAHIKQNEPASAGWEERLGAKATVWIGAIALALAGAYLVKYSFDNNLMSPAVRVGLGALFGIGLLIGAQPLHRRTQGVAAAMAAAGVAVLFACALAATRLYEFLGPTTGFLSMALVAAAAVALSLRHGRLVAVVGLSGGFLTPALIGANVPDARVTFSYLFLLQIGLIVVTRRRGWWVMALLTMIGSLTWSASFLVMIALGWAVDSSGTWVGLFIIATVGSFIFAGWSDDSTRVWGRAAIGRVMSWLSLFGALFLLAWLIGVDEFATIDWLLLGLLAAGVMVLARLRTMYQPMVWFVAAAMLMMLAVWAISMPDEHATRFLWIGGVYLALLTGGSFGLMWASTRQTQWAGLAGTAPIVLLLIGKLTDVPLPAPSTWWMVAAGLAAIVAALFSMTVWCRSALDDHGDRTMTCYATSAVALLAFAALIGLERLWIGPAWTGIALLAMATAAALRIAPLRLTVGVIGIAGMAVILLDPAVYAYAYAPRIIVNKLAAAHVLVIAAMLGAAVVDRRAAFDNQPLPTALESCAWLVALVAVGLQVRHGFAPVFDGAVIVTDGSVDFHEVSTHATAWGVLACGLLLLHRRIDWLSLRYAGPVIAFVAGLAVVFLLTLFNPLLHAADVGDRPIINGLLYGYGAPALLAGVIAWLSRRGGWPALPAGAGGAAVVLLLALVTLQVRHLFHGADMVVTDATRAGALEWTSYTNLWLVLGIGVIALGRRTTWAAADYLGLGLALLGAAAVLVALGLLTNPLWHHESVGPTPLFNWLLAMYGLPALLCVVAGRLLSQRIATVAPLLYAAALVMLFGLVSLQVRQYFHGDILDGGTTSSAEWYTYSAAWVLLGLILLGVGVVSRNRMLRYASLAVMGLAVAKVFISDTAHLDNLYRVLSFMGLGVALLLLGFVYQRFVFRKAD